MEVWKIIFLSKWVIRRFHVNLPGCWFCFVLGVPSRERSYIRPFKAGKITFPLPLRWDMLVPRKGVLMYTVLSIIMYSIFFLRYDFTTYIYTKKDPLQLPFIRRSVCLSPYLAVTFFHLVLHGWDPPQRHGGSGWRTSPCIHLTMDWRRRPKTTTGNNSSGLVFLKKVLLFGLGWEILFLGCEVKRSGICFFNLTR